MCENKVLLRSKQGILIGVFYVFLPKIGAIFSFPNHYLDRNDDDRNLYGYNYFTVMCDNKDENKVLVFFCLFVFVHLCERWCVWEE